jgi:hypothetical protein
MLELLVRAALCSLYRFFQWASMFSFNIVFLFAIH